MVAIPVGSAGTRATLRLMAREAKRAKNSPAVIQLARNIVARVPTVPGRKSYRAQAEEIGEWVRDNMQFVRDPYGLEMLTPPDFQSGLAGDCDDHAMMVASLLMAVGIVPRFVAVGETIDSLEHVYTEARIGNEWIPIETTEECPPELLPKLRARMVEHL